MPKRVEERSKMERIPEPELMDDPLQAQAYACADFSVGHQSIVDALATRFPALDEEVTCLDLGCGPLDVSMRLLSKFPAMTVHGVDGSAPMLALGQEHLSLKGLESRAQLFNQRLPALTLPRASYELIFSSSLLHHLHRPADLWQVVREFGSTGTRVYVADLFRPESLEAAQEMVSRHTPDEPELLKQDFLNSLLAAFSIDEVRLQLTDAQLGESLDIQVLTERHMVISGIL